VKLSRTATVTAAATVVAAAAAAAVITITSATAQTAARPPRPVSAVAVPPATAGQAGWQGAYGYRVPAGTSLLFFHYPCPARLVARSSGFGGVSNLSRPFSLVGDGPLYAPGSPPSYSMWGWRFQWPSGSPAGETIDFDVYCTGPA
jgi:hypothetical protein